MAREVFGSKIFGGEDRIIREIYKKDREEDNEPPEEDEEKPGFEESILTEEEEARKKLHDEAAARYEAGVTKKPARKETGEQLAPHFEGEIEAAAEKERIRLSREKDWDASGLRGPRHKPRQFNEAQGVVERAIAQRGQRSPRKRRKPGRETVREKKAA